LRMKTILVDLAHTFFIYDKGIFKEMYDLLESYPNRKILVTNASNEKMKEKGMNNLPYEVFTLENDPNKSEVKYFKELLEHYKLNPEDVIYFDHILDCVKSGELTGITSYYYDESKKDLDKLKEFLDSNLN